MISKRNLWIIVISAAFVILGTLTWGYYQYTKSNADPADQKTEIYIAAAALLQEFSESEDEANAKYFNKITCTKGVLKRIDKDGNKMTSLALDGGDSLREISCQLDPRHEDDVQKLEAGDTVE